MTQIEVPVLKRDDELRVVWGYASVVEEGGFPVVDHQGDVIAVPTLQKAAHAFMSDLRTGGIIHARRDDGNPVAIGEVVESVVLTKELQSALNIDTGSVGWLIGMKVHDDAVWAAVKDGTLAAFSIGGSATRIPL